MQLTRNRVIYAGTNVLVSDAPSWSGQTGNKSLKLLKRVQSSSVSISNPVSRAKQIGSADFAYEKYISMPEISADLSYIITDNSNELILGMNATGNEGFLKNLSATGQDRNLFFLLSDEDGEDANGITDMIGNDIFALGNAFITNYGIEAKVGSVPQASVSFSCLNMVFQSYSGTGANGSSVPAITLYNGNKSTEKYLLTGYNLDPSNYLSNQNLRATALQPGDIVLEMPQVILGGIRYSGNIPATINSLQISVPIERRDLVGFGSNYPYEKKILYPLIGTLSFNGTFDEAVTGDFSNIFTDENSYDFSFSLKKIDGTTGLKIDIFDSKVESQSFDLSIGANMEFQSQFSFKVYPEDGMRISGAARLI
jgi:hypothetical protein